MSAFLISSNKVAHRMVALQNERHPLVVRETIDGMIREFRLHEIAMEQGVVAYVPTDLPDELADAWVMNYLAGIRRKS